MTYQEAIDWLFQQFPAYHLIGKKAYKPSLANVEELVSLVGNPEKKLKFIHVAGTNGKGSTCSYTSSILTESNFKVGLFTSPHILDFRERIRINGEMIDEESVVEFCKLIQNLELSIAPSFFEITWVMALCFFEKNNCDIVVVETGLGGRLDATNIIQPVLSVITTIDLDHIDILGDTREKIAFEKAGIIKKHIPVIILAQDNEVKHVFEEIAQYRNTSITWVNLSEKIAFNHGLLGYQETNLRTVITIIKKLNELGFSISENEIILGIERVTSNTGYFGRFQVIQESPKIICDVAHNVEGISALMETMKVFLQEKRVLALYGTSSDKNLKEIIKVLDSRIEYFVTEFEHPRAAKLDQLKADFDFFKKNVFFFKSVKDAFQAIQESANENDIILVFGSFFLVSDFFQKKSN